MPFPTPWDLSSPRTEPMFPASPALAGRFFTTEPFGKSKVAIKWFKKVFEFRNPKPSYKHRLSVEICGRLCSVCNFFYTDRISELWMCAFSLESICSLSLSFFFFQSFVLCNIKKKRSNFSLPLIVC